MLYRSAPDVQVAPDVQDPLLGQQLGRYQLLRLIGAGSMGLVYAAWDESLARKVALKLVPKSAHDSWASVRPLIQVEARVAASLDHPHIVRVLEFGEDGGWCFLAMELLDGHNLKQLISTTGPFDIVRACQIMADVAEALAYAHREGVVHRDIKPANLVLTRSGRCKITDFGLAAFHAAGASEGQDRVRVGTASYMAPEIALGRQAKPVSDLYSFGATMWHLLAGAPPHAGGEGTPGQIEAASGESPALDITELRPDVPPPLAQVIGRMLDSNPERRWSDCDDLAQVLRLYSVPLTDVSERSPEGRRLTRALEAVLAQKRNRPSGRRLALGLGGALLFAALAGAGAVTGLYQIEVNQRRSAMSDLSASMANASAFREFAEADRLRGLSWLGTDVTRLLTPSDTEALDSLSLQESSPVVGVAGRVKRVQVASSGKVAHLTLADEVTADTLTCVFFPESFDAMTQAFGEMEAGHMVEQSVLIKGRITRYQSQPQIVIDAPTQLVLLSGVVSDAPRPGAASHAAASRETDP